MPIVHGKKFAYTKKGIAAAQKHLKTKKKFKKSKASPVKKAKIEKVYVKSKQIESPSKRLKGILTGLKKNYDKANDKVLSTYSRLSPNTQKNLFRLQRMYSRWQHID